MGRNLFDRAMRSRWADRLVQRVRDATDRIPTLTPMSRADQREWFQAESLADVGELTARWLEGDIGTHPSYYGRPDRETEELVPSLAALNRSGFVTLGSQPGLGPVRGVDGDQWWQRAAVDGFTDPGTAARIDQARSEAGLWMVQHHGAGRFTRYRHTIPVTASENRVGTAFGAHLSRRLVDFQFEGVAYDDLRRAEQVTVVDPEWGRNDVLWPAVSGVPVLERSPAFQRELAGFERRDERTDPGPRERIEINHRETPETDRAREER